MSASPSFDASEVAVKTALLVDADSRLEALLLDSLQPGQWVIQHAPDNKSALTEAANKVFDLIRTVKWAI